jgi:signal transduction histidine kinase
MFSRDSSIEGSADEGKHDPVRAFGPVVIVFALAVLGAGVLVAVSGGTGQQRTVALISLAGALVVALASFALLRRWRHRQKPHQAEADAALQRTQQFAASQSAIISMISHELRTPLQAMTTNLEYLEGCIAPKSEAADALARLARATTLIEGRLKNLAEYARATAEPTVRADAFALRELLLRIVDDYRGQAELRRQTLKTEFAKGTESAIQGDPIRLNQIVANYVFNAIQHSSAEDTITIRTSFSPVVAAPQRMLSPTVEVEVIDHGPGISAAVQKTLWAPFITTKTAVSPGTNGLGLAVVKLLAEAARWEVGVRPTPGGGSTFYVRLPVTAGKATGS